MAFVFALVLPQTRIQLKKTQQKQKQNKTKKEKIKMVKGTHTRSKDTKNEVWESKWAILISLEVRIFGMSIKVSILIGTLELRYLSKGRSEFDF